MRKQLACGALGVLVCAATMADEGRVPIYQPITITSSGHYVVTNDFVAAVGPAIRIEALDVTIDLNGHVVQGDVTVAHNPGMHRIRLRNGRVVGRLQNIMDPEAKGPLTASWVVALRMSNVTGFEGGITLMPCAGFDIENSRIEGEVVIIGDTDAVRAQIQDNEFSSNVQLAGLRNAVIRGNSVLGNLELHGDTLGSDGTLVERNSVRGTLLLSASGVPGSYRNVVRDNLAGTIVAYSDENQIIGNAVPSGSITIGGLRNVIDGNRVQGSGFGLVLSGENNIYRNNILHNTAGAVSDTGAGNVDAGGNVN